MFKNTTHQRVMKKKIATTGHRGSGDRADGEPVMIWKVTDTVPETLLVSADTLIGKYEYSYKKNRD